MHTATITTGNLRFKEKTLAKEKKDKTNARIRRDRKMSMVEQEGYFAEFWHQYLTGQREQGEYMIIPRGGFCMGMGPIYCSIYYKGET